MSAEDLLSKLRQSYVAGILTHLEEMENMVLNIENKHEFQENFDALYRKAHSLKGSGATYDYPIITTVCHQMEDFLTEELQNQNQANEKNINTVFAYIDILKEIHELLINESDNFFSIEKQLESLKKQNPKVRAMLIEPPEKMYKEICTQALKEANIHYSTTTSGITALQRLLNESFDLLITPRENPELSGIALVAALKINKRCNVNIESIIITSNPNIDIPRALQSSHIILKGMNFPEELTKTLDAIALKKR